MERLLTKKQESLFKDEFSFLRNIADTSMELEYLRERTMERFDFSRGIAGVVVKHWLWKVGHES